MEIKMQTVKSYMTFELIWNKFWNKKLHAQANLGKKKTCYMYLIPAVVVRKQKAYRALI
jgi:hypothetical protein